MQRCTHTNAPQCQTNALLQRSTMPNQCTAATLHNAKLMQRCNALQCNAATPYNATLHVNKRPILPKEVCLTRYKSAFTRHKRTVHSTTRLQRCI